MPRCKACLSDNYNSLRQFVAMQFAVLLHILTSHTTHPPSTHRQERQELFHWQRLAKHQPLCTPPLGSNPPKNRKTIPVRVSTHHPKCLVALMGHALSSPCRPPTCVVECLCRTAGNPGWHGGVVPGGPVRLQLEHRQIVLQAHDEQRGAHSAGRSSGHILRGSAMVLLVGQRRRRGESTRLV